MFPEAPQVGEFEPKAKPKDGLLIKEDL